MSVRLSRDDEEMAESHEINVTPFIDVILVLLIIFIVAAPLATVDVPVDLPVAAASRQPRPDKPVFLTVQADLTLLVGDKPVTAAGLGPELVAVTEGDRDRRIFLRAAKTVAYGELMDVMNDLRRAGYLKVALVGLEDGESAPTTPAAPAPRPGVSP